MNGSDRFRSTVHKRPSIYTWALSRRRLHVMAHYFWILTIPADDWSPPAVLPTGLSWLRGQLEEGAGGYRHWQIACRTTNKVRASAVKQLFCRTAHVEVSRSAAANDYVWKDESCVDPELRFELGSLPRKRNDKKDWDAVWAAAKEGKFEEIPADIRVRSYNALTKIAKDNLKPVPRDVEVYVYWGETGAGKSRRAWDEAGFDAYPKDPATKFWDGYQGQENVVIDEFTGLNQISITNMLRWLDRYPVSIETKGSGAVLRASKFWITSNIDPRDWYPEANPEQKKALRRRFTQCIHFANFE